MSASVCAPAPKLGEVSALEMTVYPAPSSWFWIRFVSVDWVVRMYRSDPATGWMESISNPPSELRICAGESVV
jgi:hypothetical protein